MLVLFSALIPRNFPPSVDHWHLLVSIEHTALYIFQQIPNILTKIYRFKLTSNKLLWCLCFHTIRQIDVFGKNALLSLVLCGVPFWSKAHCIIMRMMLYHYVSIPSLFESKGNETKNSGLEFIIYFASKQNGSVSSELSCGSS